MKEIFQRSAQGKKALSAVLKDFYQKFQLWYISVFDEYYEDQYTLNNI